MTVPYEWTIVFDRITGKSIQSYENFLHSACASNPSGSARCDVQLQLSHSRDRSRNRELFQATSKDITRRITAIKSKMNMTEPWLVNETDGSAVFEAIAPYSDEMIPMMFSDWHSCTVDMGNMDNHICKLAQEWIANCNNWEAVKWTTFYLLLRSCYRHNRTCFNLYIFISSVVPFNFVFQFVSPRTTPKWWCIHHNIITLFEDFLFIINHNKNES